MEEAERPAGREAAEASGGGGRGDQAGAADVARHRQHRSLAGRARGGPGELDLGRVARDQVDRVADPDHHDEGGERLRHRRLRPAEPAHQTERPDDCDSDRGQRGERDAEAAKERQDHRADQQGDQGHQALGVRLEVAAGDHELDRVAHQRELEAERLPRREALLQRAQHGDADVALRGGELDHDRPHLGVGGDQAPDPEGIDLRALA